MSNTTAVPSHVHQSKWGFHPCNRETFLKLKELNKLYVQALHQKAAFERWERKEPHNRVMRPKLRDSHGDVVGYGVPQPRSEPPVNGLLYKEEWLSDQDRKRAKVNWTLGAKLISEVYRAARHPHPTAEGVKQLKLTLYQIETLLREAQQK